MEESSIRSSPPPPDARGDLLFIIFTAAVLSVVLIFNVMNVVEDRARTGHGIAFWEAAVWEASSGIVLLFLEPLILILARRVWLFGPGLARKLTIHFVASVAVSFVHVMAAGAMRWAAYAAVGSHYGAFSLIKDWPYEYRKDVVVYVSIVAVYMAWRSLRPQLQASPEAAPDVLEVRDGARRHFVPLSEVIWVEAAGNYVELHRGGAGLLHRASLSAMERRLQPAGFVRIHRSRLVRRDAVAAVVSRPSGDYLVRLRDGRELSGSRRYRRPLLAD